MAEEFQERTEQATPKRKEDARKKGKVAKSYDFNSALVILASTGVLYFCCNFMYQKIANLTKFVLSNLHTIEITPKSVAEYGFFHLFFSDDEPFPIADFSDGDWSWCEHCSNGIYFHA
ncbi:FlhB HrpN YscU SpaS Family [Candidatus Kryptonium thompsonii]|nr:FlhB HrpN YscU SpaS Family [Candidatus Kryptonium thompsoni]